MAELSSVTSLTDTNAGHLTNVDQDSAQQKEPVVLEPASSVVEVSNSSDSSEVVKIISDEDQKMLFAVLQFLRKNNLAKTVDALEKETEKAGGNLKLLA